MRVDAHKVQFRFTDSVEHTVGVKAGERVLDAALQQGVPILHQCRSGSCGSCVGRLVEGDAQMCSTVAASLLKSEQKEGFRLTCVCDVHSDSVFEFDYASTAGEVIPEKVSVFIDAIDWLARDVVNLKLELAEGDWMDFQPGQFVQIRVPGSQEYRRYSMASSPQELPRMELLVRVLEQGVMSDYLRDRAKIDDQLEIEGPFGSFFWRENLKSPHVFIAGGTGLAPMMSMLDVIRQKSGIKPGLLLSFGCQDESSLFHGDELELRELWMPTLQTRISLDRGDRTKGIEVGNPVQAIGPDDVCTNTVAYLCGPPRMIQAAHEHLESLGVKPENIHAEQFVATETLPLFGAIDDNKGEK